jgi:hypothetical protein
MAGLAAFAAGFGGFLRVIGEVAAAVVSTLATRFRGPRSIVSEITGVFVGRHFGFSSSMK